MFKIIRAAASGFYQSIDARLISDPEVLDLEDSPTRGLPNVEQTGLNQDGHLTGSAQCLEFDGVDDFLFLPTIQGLGTEILLDNIGKYTPSHGSTANNIAFEGWIKIDSTLTATDNNSEFFEVTIQRNSISSTTGFDGNYVVRTIYAASAFDSDAATVETGPGGTLSSHFLNFMFATGGSFAYSVSSSCNIPYNTWTHVWCEHTVTGADLNPFFTPSPRHVFKLYINGDLNKYQTGNDCMDQANDLDPFPTTANAVTYGFDRAISFDGKVDELRIWLNSGTTDSIKGIGGLENIGLIPEQFNSQPQTAAVKTQFSPSAEYCVAWWRFETISATDLFANVADSIIDSSEYGHNGTPQNFVGSVDFSEERTLVQGPMISANSADFDFFSLSGGAYDHGGLLVINDNQNELLIEEPIQNLVSSASVFWTTSGGATVALDTLNIFYGASAYTVNTAQAGDAAIHTIDYSNLLFDRNDYTLSLRGLLTSGSPSARVVFTLGHYSNSAATTAVFDTTDWTPIVLRNTISADPNETSITGRVVIQQLHNGGTDSGSLFRVDGLSLQEGDYYSTFVGPDQIRKGGQLSWNTVD